MRRGHRIPSGRLSHRAATIIRVAPAAARSPLTPAEAEYAARMNRTIARARLRRSTAARLEPRPRPPGYWFARWLEWRRDRLKAARLTGSTAAKPAPSEPHASP